MIRQAINFPDERAAFAGEVHSLLDQLGSSEEHYSFVSAFPDLATISSVAALRGFLENYKAQLLVPVELPSIYAAYGHACRNECREVIALDQQLAKDARFRGFSKPSSTVGQLHLKRLRPLRDSRFVQRYLQAIDASQANGWHTLVYGVTLAIYSFPVRQGLIAYGQQTSASFVDSAARRLSLSKTEATSVWSEYCASLPSYVESVIAAGTFSAR